MALEWFDGFEDYSTTFPIYNNRRYSVSGTSSWDIITTYQADGRFSDSKGISQTASASPQLIYFNEPGTELACGISKNQSARSDPTTGYSLDGLSFYDGSNTANNLNVGIKANGSIVVWRGTNAASNILATSAAGLVSANTWYHLGVELVRHASSGSVNVYVDGVQVISVTGVNTGSTSISQINICKFGGSAIIDDFYVCNEAAWLGECRSSPLVPNADTAQVDFTPSTGSDNYACVDESPPNTTDYVSSETPGDIDLYEISNMSFTPVSILGVKATIVAAKDDITTRTFRSKLKSGGTTANGDTHAASNSYGFASDIYDKDPNTGSAWIKSSVDALQIGVEVVA